MAMKPTELTPFQVVQRLGGPSEVARLNGITPSAVSQWITNGIPQARLLYLKAIRPDVFGIAPKRRGRKPAREAAA